MTTTVTDKMIDTMLATIKTQKEKLAELEASTKREWVTNCSFQVDNTTPVNLQTASQTNLVKLTKVLIQQQELAAKAAELLGLPVEDEINGFKFDDWITDVRKRLALINLKTEQKRFQELEARVNTLVSPERRRELEAQALMKELGLPV